MFGRWPSSAACSGARKPGALRVRSKGEKYWSERFQAPAGRFQRLRGLAPGAEDAAFVPGAFGADDGAGEERGAAAVGEQDADLRRRAVGPRPRLGPLEQHVAVLRRRPDPFPEHVGGSGGDPLEVGRRLAVPGGAAGDHVLEPFQGPVREGVEVDRAVGVAGVERLLRVGRDGGVGELDQRHVRVRSQQLVGGVAVLPRVEHRLAVHDRQERLQLAAVPGWRHRGITQHQQAGVDRPSDETPPSALPSPICSHCGARSSGGRGDSTEPPRLLLRRVPPDLPHPGELREEGADRYEHRQGAAIIRALAWE